MQNISDGVARVSLAHLPTPLVPLKRFSEQHNLPTIWLKRDDLTDTTGSGNKLRKLEFSVGQALVEGATVLITAGGVQSNHCRATAAVASALGIKCHLLLRGDPLDPADGNLLLSQLLGARITYLPKQDWASGLQSAFDDLSQEYSHQGDSPFLIPIGASDEIGLWGYIEACAEMRRDFENNDITPGHLFSATGSGGTLGGLILGNFYYQLRCSVHGFNVCDDADYFREKISADFSAWQDRYQRTEDLTGLPISVVEGYVGPGYGRAEAPVYNQIAELGKTEGVILDPVYTGKAFLGLVSELKSGRFCDANDIVFVHTGGLFGIFPHRNQLSSAVTGG